MKKSLMVIILATASIYAYQRECRLDTPYGGEQAPFRGQEYTYNLKERIDGQTLTKSNEQGAATKTCYIQLTPADKAELRAVLAAYTVDKQLRDFVDRLDPLSLVVKVIRDIMAKWAYERGDRLPTVKDLLEFTEIYTVEISPVRPTIPTMES